MKAFLFANLPLSMLHFILFLIFRGFFGWPGEVLASSLGASSGGALWWCLMVLNSLVWGAVLALLVFPFLRKLLK